MQIVGNIVLPPGTSSRQTNHTLVTSGGLIQDREHRIFAFFHFFIFNLCLSLYLYLILINCRGNLNKALETCSSQSFSFKQFLQTCTYHCFSQSHNRNLGYTMYIMVHNTLFLEYNSNQHVMHITGGTTVDRFIG